MKTTKVIFLIDDGDEAELQGQVMAFFPEEFYNVNEIKFRQSYSHVGQHSPCNVDYAKDCIEATPEQYADLHKELIGQGYEDLQIISRYELDAILFLQETSTTLSTKFKEHGRYNEDDAVTSRDIFICILKNNKHRFRFTFGQSLQRSTKTGGNPPTAYDVLACLQKSEIGTFNVFCGDFGYDTDSRKAYKTYKAVKREWENVKRLWTEDEIEKLQEIN